MENVTNLPLLERNREIRPGEIFETDVEIEFRCVRWRIRMEGQTFCHLVFMCSNSNRCIPKHPPIRQRRREERINPANPNLIFVVESFHHYNTIVIITTHHKRDHNKVALKIYTSSYTGLGLGLYIRSSDHARCERDLSSSSSSPHDDHHHHMIIMTTTTTSSPLSYTIRNTIH